MDFEQCYEQYKALIEKVLHRCNIYGNFDEFRHIAMIALWEATRSYDSEKGGFEAYAYFMMRYQIIAEMRKQNLLQSRMMVMEDEILYACINDVQNPYRIELPLAWEELTTVERYILHSYYMEQNSDKEIAASLHLKMDTVKKRRQRLLKRLKKQLVK
ncbi:sigma-70 family RNA polymerase sigma factor [Metasolibacillus meyeri]|uniref:Sigma-70 family RNA polymerase sigma factor n=1 Tax=Metasolibacillus meyeri TaxID=1071052 RepID=A0AAW9NNC0_9BACL|nr:sigma-70 family RNA polymerase sigma factor [Metasolibacillus meyeri]MEC1177470.1 sigma-70 family RNA polymerase sigma factor [Metasolibacillus meyeri]